MTTTLFRLGARSAAHPYRVLSAWLILLMLLLAASSAFGGTARDDYRIPGTDSQAATDFLRAEFPELAGDEARVVLHARSGRVDAGVVQQVQDRVAGLPEVGSIGARWSATRDTVLLSVQYKVPVTAFEGTDAVDALHAAAAPATAAGVQVELGGLVAENAETSGGLAELIGLGAALLVLLLAFGSVVAAGLPVLVALFGLGFGSALITLLAAVTAVSTSAPMVASMVGIGVGIDYALLMANRFIELLRDGVPEVEAAGRMNAEAGSSVIFAGGTVLISLLGLGLGGLPVFASFGYATALVVLSVVSAALTLVPALCGLAGRRLVRPSRRDLEVQTRPTASARWAATVARRPVAFGAVALIVLLALAAPATAMRTWPQDAGSQPSSSTVRRAYDLIALAFGPGTNAPVLVAVDRVEHPGSLDSLAAQLAAMPGVAYVAPAELSSSGRAGVLVVEPATGPEAPATAQLIDRLRSGTLGRGVQITGTTAVFADISERLDNRLWVVIGFVVAMSLVLLTTVFRSIVVAVKAAIMNLLSVGAAYGVLTAVFQWGWGAKLFGLPHATDVSTWVPILLFAVLFGLSMDYEVFLLSRVRSVWLRTGRTTDSVVEGLGATGRVITCAALIMVAVFVAFAMDPNVVVKMIGVGMATAIAVDATLVRMVLLPATMTLLGQANWWLPGWLDSVLPHLDVHPEPLPAQVDAGAEEAPALAGSAR